MQQQPKPTDAVLGGNGQQQQPKLTDVVKSQWSNLSEEERQKLWSSLSEEEQQKLLIMSDPKLEPEIAHALASLVSAAFKTWREQGEKMPEVRSATGQH